jgi:hypothetical protein
MPKINRYSVEKHSIKYEGLNEMQLRRVYETHHKEPVSHAMATKGVVRLLRDRGWTVVNNRHRPSV